MSLKSVFLLVAKLPYKNALAISKSSLFRIKHCFFNPVGIITSGHLLLKWCQSPVFTVYPNFSSGRIRFSRIKPIVKPSLMLEPLRITTN